MAGARVSQSAMVTTIEVTYPNGRMPTSVSTMPAKIIKIHALTKNNGPAAMSLKNAPMTSSVELPVGASSARWAWQRFLARPSAADMTRASSLIITTRPAAGHGRTVRNLRGVSHFSGLQAA